MKTTPFVPQSITDNPLFAPAVVALEEALTACNAANEETDPTGYEAATDALHAQWDVLAAIADAHTTQQLAAALRARPQALPLDHDGFTILVPGASLRNGVEVTVKPQEPRQAA